jgi:hypothetical protein
MPRALILALQRRSMVSSIPITTGALDGTRTLISRINSRRAPARDDQVARLRIRWKVQKSGSRSRLRMRSAAVTVRRPGARMDAGKQHQNVRPGRAREQIGESHDPRQKSFRQRRARRVGEKMGLLHPIGRIGALNRGNLPRCDKSNRPVHRASRVRGTMGTLSSMTKIEPTLAQIAAQFTRHGVEKSGGGYTILDRRTSNPVARLRPIPNTDRFELFYWSNIKVAGPPSETSAA